MPSLGTKTVYAEPGPPYKTAEQMTELCCEPRPQLQCREKVVGDIQPDMQKALENLGLTLDAQGRDQNGRLVKLVYKERKNPCGKVVHRYKVEQKDCCEEVEPLAIDADRSVSVLAPGTSGNVYFTGGRFPVLVKLRGNGFTLDGYNQRDGWVDGPNRGFTVYAHESACGFAPITLSDGCSVADGGVRSTAGRWSLIGEFEPSAIAVSMGLVFSIFHSTCPGMSSDVDAYQYQGRYAMTPVSAASYPPGSKLSYSCIYYAAYTDIAGVGFMDPVIGKFYWPFCKASENMGSYWRVWTTPGAQQRFKISQWVC